VGAIGVHGSAGAAYIFQVASERLWSTTSTPTAVLTNSASASRNLGWSLSLSADGTTALVGAYDSNGSVGAADIFRAASEGSWTSTSTPGASLSAGSGSDEFGSAVAISADGGTAIVGVPETSAAYVFHAKSESSWSTTTTPTATLTGAANFGASVAISPDGTTALVGAYSEDTEAGAAYVFHVASAGSWTTTSVATATLTNSAEPSFGELGLAETFSNDGTTATVSGWFGADVYKATSESAWTTSATPQATLTGKALDELLSAASSSDGTTVLVGAVESNGADVFELPATPAKLAFTAEPPRRIKAGAPFSVKVSVEGSSGNVITTDNTDRVTLARTAPARSPGGVMRCTNDPVIVSKGVASFTCRIDKAASGYKLPPSPASLCPPRARPLLSRQGKPPSWSFPESPPGGPTRALDSPSRWQWRAPSATS
jgi:hypothetical protein